MATFRLNSALASCNYYPAQVDLCRRLIWFAEIDRETYRRAGFLVPRHAKMGQERYGFNLDDVLLHDLSLPIGGAASHYIFISALCCSTLLARLLDEVPGCLVLKEPSILGQLGMLRYRRRKPPVVTVDTADPSLALAPREPFSIARGNGSIGENRAELGSYDSPEWEENWRTWAELCIRLLTRTFEPGQTVIIKAADTCNTMSEVILANDARSKGVLLSVGLKTFILSVLKHESRRDWTRKRAAFWHKTLALFPALSEPNVPELDDAHKAAYIWLVTAALWDRFRRQVEPERLLLVDGEDVSENPGSALRKVSRFFSLPLSEERTEDILGNPVLSHHAKFPGRTYDAATRKSDLADWGMRFGAEADPAMDWAASVEEKLRLDGVDLSSMAGTECNNLAPSTEAVT